MNVVGRETIGYDHGYAEEVFYLGLAVPLPTKGSSRAAWRGSARTSRRTKICSVISGRRATSGSSS
jgi:hypothetical protein